MSNAQSPAVKHFAATRFGNTVAVDWTIFSGFQCADVELYYGSDTLNMSHIHTEFGICGSDTADESYRFLHRNPAQSKTEYYRLKLGFNEYSEFFLLENQLSEVEVTVNPIGGFLRVAYDPGFTRVDLVIRDYQGRRIAEVLQTLSFINEIPLAGMEAGIYILEIIREGDQSINRKFIKY